MHVLYLNCGSIYLIKHTWSSPSSSSTLFRPFFLFPQKSLMPSREFGNWRSRLLLSVICAFPVAMASLPACRHKVDNPLSAKLSIVNRFHLTFCAPLSISTLSQHYTYHPIDNLDPIATINDPDSQMPAAKRAHLPRSILRFACPMKPVSV